MSLTAVVVTVFLEGHGVVSLLQINGIPEQFLLFSDNLILIYSIPYTDLGVKSVCTLSVLLSLSDGLQLIQLGPFLQQETLFVQGIQKTLKIHHLEEINS